MSDKPMLQSASLSVKFGGIAALRDVSIGVYSGEIVGLIGPNGSGKSTWINSVTGLVRPTGGRVLIGETDATGWAPHRVWRLGVGRTFQKLENFPHMSVEENLVTAAQEAHGSMASRLVRRYQPRSQQRVAELLDLVGLANERRMRIGQLSYGQQKLCDLAMALVADPQIVLLDEPMAGVNPTLIERLVAAIKRLHKDGKTFLIVEHNMRVLMSLCTRIIALDAGQVIVDGTPDTVRGDPRVMEAYFGT